MGKELVNSVNVLGKGNKVPDAVLVELTGGGLTQDQYNHLGNQGFRDWLSGETNSRKTYHDYLSYVKGFYIRAYETKGIEQPIRLETEEDFNIVKDIATNYINSRATEYGVRKYLDYLVETRGFTESKNANLLDKQLQGIGEKGKTSNRKEKIGKKVRAKKTVSTIINKAPEHTDTLRPEEFNLFLKLMYDTAARVGDAQRLMWKDYDGEFRGRPLSEDDQKLVIRADRSKSEESGTVQLPKETAKRLKKHREKVRDDDNRGDSPNDYIFFQNRESRKKNYRRIRRAFLTAGKKYTGVDVDSSEVDFGTHNFRHSKLTHLGRAMLEDDERDLSYSDVRERLRRYARHQDPQTTEVYIEILKDRYQIDISKYQD